VANGEIVSMAQVLFMTTSNWEIGAVHTLPQQRGQGHAMAVCAFAAKYILEHGKRATCSTAMDNIAMQKVMQKIGMRKQK
jgi:predicted GNAT family acetyltransferase